MILGILSDTHGKAAVASAAVKLLRRAGAGWMIHCGDVGSTAVLNQLAGGDPPAGVVWGNTDFDWPELARYATALGIANDHPILRVNLAGRRIAVTHGDDGSAVRSVLEGGQTDILLSGHTHERDDHFHGRVRCINPGALHRARVLTVATLDLVTGDLHWIEVQRTP